MRRALLYIAAGTAAGVGVYSGWRWYNTHYRGGGAGAAVDVPPQADARAQ